jgi:uncharacterized phiE125 gp8 family phage protein
MALVTGPTEEPVSLIEAKQHCRIDSTDDDGLLAGYIIAARIYCEGETRRAFVTQTWDFSIDYGWPLSHRIELPLGKVQSVTSVSYVDTDGASQTLSGSLYTAKTNKASAYIVPAYNATWPDVRGQVDAITVRYVAGWLAPEVPQDIRQAMLLLIGAWYEHREEVVLGQAPSQIPMGVEAILSSYRIHSL